MVVAVQGGRLKEMMSTLSKVESPYDVTADDWHAHWHEENEAERLKRIKRLDWYTRPKDFATVGYRGMHQHKIEYSAADHERFDRHRASFASRNAHKADNQTSSRLFGDAEPKVRLPAALVITVTVKINPSPAVSAPTAIPPHLRGFPGYSTTCDVRSNAKREGSIDHAQASESRTTALTVKTGEGFPPSVISCPGVVSGPCLASSIPKTVSALNDSHALIQEGQLHHTQSIARSLSPTSLLYTDDVCPICEGSYTHDEPGVSTPCCGLLIHQLCNFEALEEHGRCYGCHGDQATAEIPQPGSPSETDEYIRHFDTNPQSFSTCSLKSEQVGASSTTSAVMTLREYVESQAESCFVTSSLATDASSASFSWLSSVEDDEIEDDDSWSSASARPATTAGIEILNGGTENLVDACRKFGMCVNEEFKDTIIERNLVGLERKIARPPPLPTTELDLAVIRTMPHSSREEQLRILQSIASNRFSRGSSTAQTNKRQKCPQGAFPQESWWASSE